MNSQTNLDLFQLVREKNLSELIRQVNVQNINGLDEDKQNLLHESISNGSEEICAFLILEGINVNQQDRNGQTPLHYSVIYKQKETIILILENNGDVNIKDNHGNNALWTATFNARGDYETVQILIYYGGDATSKNKYNKSPLDFSKQIGDDELFQILSNKTSQ